MCMNLTLSLQACPNAPKQIGTYSNRTNVHITFDHTQLVDISTKTLLLNIQHGVSLQLCEQQGTWYFPNSKKQRNIQSLLGAIVTFQKTACDYGHVFCTPVQTDYYPINNQIKFPLSSPELIKMCFHTSKCDSFFGCNESYMRQNI